MLKVASIIGARPQFIKASAVSRQLQARGIKEILVHTGQHYDVDMSEVFFKELELPKPDYHLGIGGGSHGENTGRMIEAIERVILDVRPDIVLVYGDTDSTLAGALAAVKLHIPVAHVEAGLRSFNRKMPEEINRILTDHASDILFAPTESAVSHLAREGISNERIYLVGDVMYDSALHYERKARQISQILRRLNLKTKKYILATIHRKENTDDPTRLEAILRLLVEAHKAFPVVFPVHPRTRNAALRFGLAHLLRSVRSVKPVGYLDMVMLEKNARLIVTDSGGVQKEAFFYRVPCVTLREETEWAELIDMGWNQLLSPQRVDATALLSVSPGSEPGKDPYGGGMASSRIADVLWEVSRV